MTEKTFDITQRVEITDVPQDSLNQLPGIRQKLVQLRNSSRLSKSKAEKLRETLQFFLDSLTDPDAEPVETGNAPVPSSDVMYQYIAASATKAQPKSKKPAQKATGTRRATAKVDKANA